MVLPADRIAFYGVAKRLSLAAPTGSPQGLPSLRALRRVMEALRAALFPGYIGPSSAWEVCSALEKAHELLREQILKGLCAQCSDHKDCRQCEERAEAMTQQLLCQLPDIQVLLLSDAQAAYLGDPAAKSVSEVILCYPSLWALTCYRIAHTLLSLGVPLIPRMITEMAHSDTGIDIHPGAEIGEHFFMDHGTGIVIGETAVIGNRVKVYQGVTLGAKSFPLDEKGNPVKGIPRHPIVEDDVIIYAGATILGRVRIGRGSIIGGNTWITRDVPPRSRILQPGASNGPFLYGEGI